MNRHIDWKNMSGSGKSLVVRTIVLISDGNGHSRGDISSSFGFTSDRGHDVNDAFAFLHQERIARKVRNPVTGKEDHFLVAPPVAAAAPAAAPLPEAAVPAATAAVSPAAVVPGAVTSVSPEGDESAADTDDDSDSSHCTETESEDDDMSSEDELMEQAGRREQVCDEQDVAIVRRQRGPIQRCTRTLITSQIADRLDNSQHHLLSLLVICCFMCAHCVACVIVVFDKQIAWHV